MARRLLDLQLNQVERRTRRVVNQVELQELRAIKLLGYRLFGDSRFKGGAAIDFPINPLTQQRIGPIRMGYWLEDEPLQVGRRAHRRARWLFEGATHRELVDQVTMWRAHRGGSG